MSLRDQLAKFQQEHVLAFYDELDPAAQERFTAQLGEIDLEQLATLIAGQDEAVDFGEIARRATLPSAVASDGSGVAWSLEEARERGEQALRDGEIAAIVVAGGQGTRLGFDQPKGMFPIGPVSQRTLFQTFADLLIATAARYGRDVPLYIMTSEATDAATREYLQRNDYLGLPPDQVTVFKQGTMPAVDAETGKLLLAEKGSLALSPDGHGGTLAALERHGCLQKMADAGQKHLFYFQVDNPLIDLCDPVFIGHHLLSESEMTSQVIRKRYPTEKVGNVVQVDGHTMVIEYSDLPDEAAEMRDESGGLKLWAGSIAVHLFDLNFLRRMAASDTSLPLHRAFKKVPFLNAEGQPVKPPTPNAIKFEKFIFDLLPSAQRTLICEVQPSHSFAPVKNAAGAETDTAETAQAAMVALHRNWVEAAGGTVDPGVTLEINPRFALDASELAAKLAQNVHLTEPRYFEG